jgi:DNA replication and repair protein RecF
LHIHVLSLGRFRNLTEVLFAPHPHFNIIHGENGQGKTNILEAIYLLATLRSFRTARIEEMIQFGQDASLVQAQVVRKGVERRLAVALRRESQRRKEALVDGKPAGAIEYFGGMNVVLFCPDDLHLPKGPPAQRRRFLDRAVWNTCAPYLKEAQTYERILKSRNALLRSDPRPQGFGDMLEVYDEQLAQTGAKLIIRRQRYMEDLTPLFDETFARISRSGLQVSIRYRQAGQRGQEAQAGEAAGADVEGTAQALLAQLGRDRRRDIARGYTHGGPHADDLDMDLDGRPAAIHASQGQLRALVLALKIAEIRHLAATLGDTPVLLLDDVSSELDAARNAYLFDFLHEIPCQTFITTTSPNHIKLPARKADDGDEECLALPIRRGSLDVTPGNVVQ